MLENLFTGTYATYTYAMIFTPIIMSIYWALGGKALDETKTPRKKVFLYIFLFYFAILLSLFIPY